MILAIALPLMFGYLAGMTPPPQEVQKAEHVVTESTLCSCVSFVRQWRPDIPLMDASRFVPATTTASLNAVALMYYPKSGLHHLALVIGVDGDTITLRDANYSPCSETVRTITLPDRVVGFL